MNKKNLFSDFLILFNHLDSEMKLKIYFSTIVMTIASFLEVLSISALIPFVTAILSPEKLAEIQFVNLFLDTEDLQNINYKLIFTIIFISSIVIANTFRIFVLYLLIKLSKTIPLKLAEDVYKKTIETDYNILKQKNSASIISMITDKMDSLSGVFFNFLSACSALIIIMAIVTLLFLINVKITLVTILTVLFLYSIIGFLFKKKLKENSIILSKTSVERIKHVKETFGSMKQLILYDAKNLFQKIFTKYDKDFRLSQFKSQFLMTCPRFIVEAIGIIAISLAVYFLHMTLKYEAISIITLVAALAFSAQKLLPQVNIVYIFYSTLINYSSFIKEINFILKEIKHEKINIEINKADINNLDFKHKIRLREISFKYERNDTNVLKSFNFEIKKNSKIAIIGETGSGKSTLLDIIMGLLEPLNGSLEVDGNKIFLENIKKWQKKFSHVPQETFLFDNTIKKNIIFDFYDKNIELSKVVESAKLAEIHDFIERLPDKYETIVGENGILLSGGQKQRIGIARALYKDKEILTLDEATNALDIKTEKKILDNITKKNITIIQITHRVNNITNYDGLIEL